MVELLFLPFAEFGFMARALVACMAVGLGAAPIGVLLVLRRMSLVGDAMAHAVLPGVAIGFLLAGFSVAAMTAGGVVAGLLVALLAGGVHRFTGQREDASFAAFYLIAMAVGVLLISVRGSNTDLVHVLFGNLLAVDDAGLLLVASVATATIVAVALFFRGLVTECLDPEYLRACGSPGGLYHGLFLGLVVLNLVAGFHALGTLMAVGLMMLPAAAARYWAGTVAGLMAAAAALALLSAWAGLLLSYHLGAASGPAVVLVAGMGYAISVLFGPHGGLITRLRLRRHLEA
ncbi:metal ABC transporter permease [Aquisalimonas asiatica]|uniref:Zinc/manganese transport system permease protein n=1 Tax=Aquisalimonas asiatica TaxID=406100 RepID=A0A1H8SXI9_9GAMM|nr:metal ABC transporter permease [Aquisalimonas asiatica]SEO83245.1 zinc/manganese transport system permease protein [Aquisalimonas asiatica]